MKTVSGTVSADVYRPCEREVRQEIAGQWLHIRCERSDDRRGLRKLKQTFLSGIVCSVVSAADP
jgi:hypothetical protein